ncbi:biotin--[acetyl-CoA-carboxylase] ligase [[Clostridium] fimetarium]|uniref:Bifunctional ligase/repressor BirA n=1 Tax=[Clostridium] fimetarium TaxID=99656 RepID=A0A1I0M9M7_9FIRM|nr:biotin--[acetyl-CoA-carboxylase] ligase [[Clostridium] fimetarium]SEV84426.1 BirA family transcriptional regulator, biotin operon repressor / biotin-[acetyl-CoA-carboxylase] ligase [[Clostridium] fimetarium]
MKTKILKVLRNSDKYISGQSICDELGISRTAVWKYMNQLKEDGYGIEATQNKGYNITKYPDVLTEVELGSLFETAFFGNKIYFYDEIDSTNNEAKKKAEDGAKQGTLVIAECQNGGRGRRGKKWISPSGSGIWMSFVLKPTIHPYGASMITLVAALSVVSALKNIKGLECNIKWPNDIVANGKKICGILTEMSSELDAVNYVIIGIGININSTEFDEEISDIASSVFLETGLTIKRSQVVADFAKYFEKYYSIFMQTQDLRGLIDEYNGLLVNVGKEVKINNINSQFIGNAIGINDKGELLVKKQDGSVEKVIAGEVSVRGLYGYV